VIDYIHERCRSWGAQLRWVTSGQDGWPSRTMLARMIAEGLARSFCGAFRAALPGSLSPRCARDQQRHQNLKEAHREILFVHYVVVGQGKAKAHAIGIHIQTYYDPP